MNEVDLVTALGQKLDKFEWIELGRKATFRCPICGDSRKDPNKKRAALILVKTFVFSCLNCSETMSLQKFAMLIDYDCYREFRLNSIRAREPTFNRVATKPKNEKEFSKGRSLFGDLRPVAELTIGHPAELYLRARGLSFLASDVLWAEDFNSFARRYSDSVKSDRVAGALVLPLITSTGIEFGFQGRYIDADAFIRYKTVMVDKRFRKCYGQHKINSGRKINMTEGVFDAAFLSNSLASLDADLAGCAAALPWKKDCFVLWFDHEPKNPHVMANKAKAIEEGFAVAFYNNILAAAGKDINDMMLSDYTPAMLREIRATTSASGVRAKLLLSKETRR